MLMQLQCTGQILGKKNLITFTVFTLRCAKVNSSQVNSIGVLTFSLKDANANVAAEPKGKSDHQQISLQTGCLARAHQACGETVKYT